MLVSEREYSRKLRTICSVGTMDRRVKIMVHVYLLFKNEDKKKTNLERFYPVLHNILGNPVMSCNFLINLSIIVVVSTFSMRTYIPNKIKYQKRRTPILPVVLYCLTKRRHTIKTLVQISLIHKFILIIENRVSTNQT